MPFIRIQCINSRCKTRLSIPAHLAGQRVKCSCCGQMIRVPERPSMQKKNRRVA